MEKDESSPPLHFRNFNTQHMSTIKARLSGKKEIERSLTRLVHEIIEKNNDLSQIALVGIRTRGDFLAQRLHLLIEKLSDKEIPIGTLDVTFHRDDFRTNLGSPKVGVSNILFEVEGRNIILIDDVLYTGRTIRAAMDEIFTYGRPNSIQLGILVDRGHKELPIRADYVGKNYPTAMNEHIHVHVDEVDGEDAILLVEYKDTE